MPSLAGTPRSLLPALAVSFALPAQSQHFSSVGRAAAAKRIVECPTVRRDGTVQPAATSAAEDGDGGGELLVTNFFMYRPAAGEAGAAAAGGSDGGAADTGAVATGRLNLTQVWIWDFLWGLMWSVSNPMTWESRLKQGGPKDRLPGSVRAKGPLALPQVVCVIPSASTLPRPCIHQVTAEDKTARMDELMGERRQQLSALAAILNKGAAGPTAVKPKPTQVRALPAMLAGEGGVTTVGFGAPAAAGGSAAAAAPPLAGERKRKGPADMEAMMKALEGRM